MFIGSLLDKMSGADIKYSYTKRGLDALLYPDVLGERDNKEVYGARRRLYVLRSRMEKSEPRKEN